MYSQLNLSKTDELFGWPQFIFGELPKSALNLLPQISKLKCRHSSYVPNGSVQLNSAYASSQSIFY